MSVIPEKEFPVGKHTYRATRVDAFEQMNMASEFREAIMGLALLKKERDPKISDADFAKAAEFVMTGGAGRVAPDVRERVMRRCLRVVTRKQPGEGGWAAVTNADGGLMFQDLDLADTVMIMYHVFDHNGLLDFFSDGPLSSGGPQAAEPGQHFRTPRTGSSPRS
jgi:hypothetical protein